MLQPTLTHPHPYPPISRPFPPKIQHSFRLAPSLPYSSLPLSISTSGSPPSPKTGQPSAKEDKTPRTWSSLLFSPLLVSPLLFSSLLLSSILFSTLILYPPLPLPPQKKKTFALTHLLTKYLTIFAYSSLFSLLSVFWFCKLECVRVRFFEVARLPDYQVTRFRGVPKFQPSGALVSEIVSATYRVDQTSSAAADILRKSR